MAQRKKIEIFVLIVSYNSPLLHPKILEGKPSMQQRNLRLNKAAFREVNQKSK